MDLATRVQDFLEMTKSDTCLQNDGDLPSLLRIGLADSLASVICGAEGLLANMGPFRALTDILVINAGGLPWTNPDITRAMNRVVVFATTNAAALRMTTSTASSVAVVAFALSWLHLNQGQKLGTDNVIPASSPSGCSTGHSLRDDERRAVHCVLRLHRRSV